MWINYITFITSHQSKCAGRLSTFGVRSALVIIIILSHNMSQNIFIIIHYFFFSFFFSHKMYKHLGSSPEQQYQKFNNMHVSTLITSRSRAHGIILFGQVCSASSMYNKTVLLPLPVVICKVASF